MTILEVTLIVGFIIWHIKRDFHWYDLHGIYHRHKGIFTHDFLSIYCQVYSNKRFIIFGNWIFRRKSEVYSRSYWFVLTYKMQIQCYLISSVLLSQVCYLHTSHTSALNSMQNIILKSQDRSILEKRIRALTLGALCS